MDFLANIDGMCRVCLQDTSDSDGIVILNSEQIQKLIYIGDSCEVNVYHNIIYHLTASYSYIHT